MIMHLSPTSKLGHLSFKKLLTKFRILRQYTTDNNVGYETLFHGYLHAV